ncbi:hypothetical protein BJY14_008093 [Actinomadura luteofluorescens]|uniref:Uncharacterized protein n=1 Tax=Actinomadura luteofluorescens TaxID=46163 RepID=A0A7Y9EQI3_9ACTN|nr:hypothetical protein [Actinomadura luteofluorescens]
MEASRPARSRAVGQVASVLVFALVYLLAAPAPLRRRLWQLAAAGECCDMHDVLTVLSHVISACGDRVPLALP